MAKSSRSKKVGSIRRKLRQLRLLMTFVGVLVFLNLGYQFIKKPTEIFHIFGLGVAKTPGQTWESYSQEFMAHSTPLITPEFLAALAQAESSGNPVAQPPWIWRWTRDVFRVYSPATTAVGLMQVTDGNFEEAKKLCIQNGQVAQAGPWYEPEGCWFNFLYSRIFASDSIEMTAAFLDQEVSSIINQLGFKKVSIENKQRLAAVIHLCGKTKARLFARSAFGFKRFKFCGSHRADIYVRKVFGYKSKFVGLSSSQLIN